MDMGESLTNLEFLEIIKSRFQNLMKKHKILGEKPSVRYTASISSLVQIFEVVNWPYITKVPYLI